MATIREYGTTKYHNAWMKMIIMPNVLKMSLPNVCWVAAAYSPVGVFLSLETGENLRWMYF